MKNIIILIFCLFSFLAFAQRGYNNNTNHYKGNYIIEPGINLGENNIGVSLNIGYHPMDLGLIKLGVIGRKFEYKNYTEDILEGTLGFNYTVIPAPYDSRLFSNFNIAAMGGVAFEMVKVTSKTTLIEPYPNYIYGYLGAQLEFTLNDRLGLQGNFKQYYAFNGSEEELGNWRYDYGISLRYYIYGR